MTCYTLAEALDELARMPEGRDRRRVRKFRHKYDRPAFEALVSRAILHVGRAVERVRADVESDADDIVDDICDEAGQYLDGQLPGADGVPLRGSLIAVAAAAVIGAIIRYLVTKWLERHFGEVA